MDTAIPPTTKPSALDWIFRVLGFLTLVAVAFALPSFPATDLDSSWRMALGKFFLEGRQFGTDVVFTYGPLGFVMGKTYWGGQWDSLIAWQAAQAIVLAGIVFWQAYRVTGYARLFHFAFFFLWGLSYQDAVHQTFIALVGLELVRRAGQSWRWSSLAMLVFLATLSLVKFTNMMLAGLLVLLAGGMDLWLRRRVSSLRLPAAFLGLFVLGWILCGQNPGNIPAYLRSSWEISQGYQDAMGLSCPPQQLYLGLTVLGLVLAYLALNLLTHADRLRCFALTLGTGAYLFLNWKHGFIRADGHQIGFYYAALTVIVSTPMMLADDLSLRPFKRPILLLIGVLALYSVDQVLPGVVRGCLGSTQHKVNESVSFALGQANTRGLYEQRLEIEKNAIDLGKTKAKVGRASIDVLGFEQGVALFNGLNYQPRPVFQGYSAYTPYLSRLNYEYYASDRAPEYVLFKLQTIDGRLSTMDDPHALRMLIQRYTYVFSEQGFTLWKRKSGPFDAASFAPKPIRTTTVKLGQKINLAGLASQNIWVEVDYRFSLLGKLRRFFFRPILVQLRITDEKGVETVHRLPRPIGQTGFMLNPVVDELLSFMRAAGGTPSRHAISISIETAPQDRDCLQDDIKISLSSMPPSDAGTSFFKEADKALFNMFVDYPDAYEALNPPNADVIDKRPVMVMHAPSEMVFQVPAGATKITGAYGFLPGAYSDGGRTNGSVFLIYWNDGGESVVLHERYMDPVNKINDRGLQKFTVDIPRSSGRVFLRVTPGPYGQYAFDWTAWTGIEFK